MNKPLLCKHGIESYAPCLACEAEGMKPEIISHCPFCDSNKVKAVNIIQQHCYIQCTNCLAMGPLVGTVEDAWKMWNR